LLFAQGICREGAQCASDFRHLIVTLTVDGGFDVVFAIKIETATAMARDLASSVKLLAEMPPLWPH